MKVTTSLPAKRIADLMITAIECNDMTRSWCAGIHRCKGPVAPKGEGPWYAYPAFYDGDFAIEVKEIDDESTGHITKHWITKADFEAGLQIMAEKHGQHFGDILDDNEDAITADVFLQCVTLKELVYG